jgi:hypothetical protein
MRHCYLCDDAISGSGFRRSVGTGRSNRISVGRRVSTSSTQRNGLRTLCAACAGRVDEGVKLKNKAVGVAAVLFVGFVIYASSGGSQAPARQTASSSYDTPAATPVTITNPSAEGAPRPPSGGSLPIISSAEAATVNTAALAVPRPSAPLPAWNSAAAVRWKHRTGEGTRWSLKQLRANGMALLVDLGDDQVATVLVTPEFQNLDAATMEKRVEYVRSEVLKASPTSAAYTFARSGAVSPFQ